MSKSLRLTEQMMRRGLWVVAVVFAFFLLGLGGTFVRDLPKVEAKKSIDDFMGREAVATLRGALKANENSTRDIRSALEQAELKRRTARADSAASQETFRNWLSTRNATRLSDQDPELIERTRALDELKDRERTAEKVIEGLQQDQLMLKEVGEQTQRKLNDMESNARIQLDSEMKRVELRVFLYRLALTLPLLAIAAWLVVTKKTNSATSTSWPFAWGFIIFAAIEFFVELVPYLPSYGGYVRYTVGIVLTVVVGRRVIMALNAYLERQKMAEAMPDAQRREELSYDTALTRLSKGVCPGCERAVDLKNAAIDFCPHCGIGLYDHCQPCSTRKSAFSKFCHGCGASAQAPIGNGPDKASTAS